MLYNVLLHAEKMMHVLVIACISFSVLKDLLDLL